MNIFILSQIIEDCAIFHCDSHVVKMITESNQLLCSAHHICGSKNSDYKIPYKLTHKNHPCAIWTRESIGNYVWLSKLCKALCKEYTFRYGKVHKGEEVVDSLIENLPLIEKTDLTPFPLAMPNMYKSKDPVDSYRCFYYFEKTKLHKWSGNGKFGFRNTPSWILEYQEMTK